MSDRTPPLPTLQNLSLRDLRPVRFAAIVEGALDGARYVYNGSQRIRFRPTKQISSSAVYVFEHLTLKAGVPEDEWIGNIDSERWPTVNLWSKLSNQSPAPSAPIHVACYTDHAPYGFSWMPSGDPDALEVSVTGFVNASNWMVEKGLAALPLVIVLNAYEVTNRLWINEFLKGWENSWVNDELGTDGRSVKIIETNGGTQTLRERNF